MTCAIINEIEGIEDYSYLELGIYNNKNFNVIKCKNKYSVDTNGRAMFTGTTDDYFAQLNKNTKFDIVFIDANHDYDYVLRDFNNSVKICNQWIILHDMVPPDKEHTNTKFCSDSYKVLHYIKNNTDLEVFTLDNNYGLTFVRMPGVELNPDSYSANLSYEDFVSYISGVKLYSNDEMKHILRGKNV
jgi:hypothetical protein